MKKRYAVICSASGFVEIEAESEDEALRIANETLTWDDVYWDEDFLCDEAILKSELHACMCEYGDEEE